MVKFFVSSPPPNAAGQELERWLNETGKNGWSLALVHNNEFIFQKVHQYPVD